MDVLEGIKSVFVPLFSLAEDLIAFVAGLPSVGGLSIFAWLIALFFVLVIFGGVSK